MGRKFNFASRFNAIDANRALGKIFLFLIFRICVYDAPSRLIEEGRIAIVTDVEAGSGGTHRIAAWVYPAPTNDPVRTVKPCGPGIPVLMPSWRQRLRVAPMTGARKPVPGESAE